MTTEPTTQTPDYENPAAHVPPRTETLLARLHTVLQMKSLAEKSEKEILAQLKPLVDPELDQLENPDTVEIKEHRTVKQTYGTHVLTMVPGVNRSIKRDKLLEKGVDPEIIDYATDVVTYFQYRVSMVKQNEEETEQ